MYTKILLGFLLTIFWPSNSIASDFFSLLDVRYETGLKKTFISGPFNGKAWCEKLTARVKVVVASFMLPTVEYRAQPNTPL